MKFRMWVKGIIFCCLVPLLSALEAPVDIGSVDISTHSMTVMWRNSDGEARWFEATISPLNDGETTQGIKYINVSVVTWVDLVPGKNYTISVVAISENGRISPAAESVITTKPMPTYRIRLSKFVNPVLAEYSLGTNRTMMFPVYGAVVFWEGPETGYYDGYELTVNPPHGVVRLPMLLKAATPIPQTLQKRRIVWDLVPGVLYEFTVRTRSNNVLSDSSSVSDRMPPEIPAAIRIDSITPTTANLSWNEPHRGILDGFVVEVDPVEGGIERPLTSSQKNRHLYGLTPGTRYLVEVYSTSFGILSFNPRSRSIDVPPMPPVEPVVPSNLQEHSVTLSWQVPVGRVEYYEVVYYPTLRDFGRLRHRIYDPVVTLTNLQPNTQYSLILYSVSNLVFSQPLLATVWTGGNTTTVTPRTAVFSTAPDLVTAKDTEIDEGGDIINSKTEATPNEIPTTHQSLINRIKAEVTTAKPQVNTVAIGKTLPPHYSIPNVEVTVKPFPSTPYFPGRVTTNPSQTTGRDKTARSNMINAQETTAAVPTNYIGLLPTIPTKVITRSSTTYKPSTTKDHLTTSSTISIPPPTQSVSISLTTTSMPLPTQDPVIGSSTVFKPLPTKYPYPRSTTANKLLSTKHPFSKTTTAGPEKLEETTTTLLFTSTTNKAMVGAGETSASVPKPRDQSNEEGNKGLAETTTVTPLGQTTTLKLPVDLTTISDSTTKNPMIGGKTTTPVLTKVSPTRKDVPSTTVIIPDEYSSVVPTIKENGLTTTFQLVQNNSTLTPKPNQFGISTKVSSTDGYNVDTQTTSATEISSSSTLSSKVNKGILTTNSTSISATVEPISSAISTSKDSLSQESITVSSTSKETGNTVSSSITEHTNKITTTFKQEESDLTTKESHTLEPDLSTKSLISGENESTSKLSISTTKPSDSVSPSMATVSMSSITLPTETNATSLSSMAEEFVSTPTTAKLVESELTTQSTNTDGYISFTIPSSLSIKSSTRSMTTPENSKESVNTPLSGISVTTVISSAKTKTSSLPKSTTTKESLSKTFSSNKNDSKSTPTTFLPGNPLSGTDSVTAITTSLPDESLSRTESSTIRSPSTEGNVSKNTTTLPDEFVSSSESYTTMSSNTSESALTVTTTLPNESLSGTEFSITMSSNTDESVSRITTAMPGESLHKTESSTTKSSKIHESVLPTTSFVPDESLSTTKLLTPNDPKASPSTTSTHAITTHSLTAEEPLTTTTSTSIKLVSLTTVSSDKLTGSLNWTSTPFKETILTTPVQSASQTTSSKPKEVILSTTPSVPDEIFSATSSVTRELIATDVVTKSNLEIATTFSSTYTPDETYLTDSNSSGETFTSPTSIASTPKKSTSIATPLSSKADPAELTTPKDAFVSRSLVSEQPSSTIPNSTFQSQPDNKSSPTTASSKTFESVSATMLPTNKSISPNTLPETNVDASTPNSNASTSNSLENVISTTIPQTLNSMPSATSQPAFLDIEDTTASAPDKPLIRDGSQTTTTKRSFSTENIAATTPPPSTELPTTENLTSTTKLSQSGGSITTKSNAESPNVTRRPTSRLTTTTKGDTTTTKGLKGNEGGSIENTRDNGTTSNGGSEMTIGTDGSSASIRQGYTTICKPNNITVLVDKDVIETYERQYGPLHLNDAEDPACVGVEHPTYYRYTIAPDLLSCGTRIELNETHVNFTNTVSNTRFRAQWYKNISDHSGLVILGNRAARNPGIFLHMRIWCTFPLDLSVSMDYPFLPQITLQVLTFNISGRGQFSAVMQLYKSNLYEDPYLTPPTLQSNETLYVGVSLLEIQDNSTFMTLRRCWGTPERAPDHAQQYPIISDYCKVPESLGGSIRVIDNGESRRVKWEGSVFKFISFRQVWLHCEIRVCFGDDCKPDCDEPTSRRRRSANNGNEGSHVITTGPISLNKLREPVLEPVGSNTTPQTGAASIDMERTTVLIVVGALCFIILLCFVIIVCVLIRLRKRHSQKSGASISSLPSSIETTCEFQVPATNGTDYLEICRPATSVSSFSLASSPSGGKNMAQNVHPVSQLDSLNETGSSQDNPAYDGSSLDISSPPYNSAYKLPMNTNKEPGETLPGNS